MINKYSNEIKALIEYCTCQGIELKYFSTTCGPIIYLKLWSNNFLIPLECFFDKNFVLMIIFRLSDVKLSDYYYKKNATFVSRLFEEEKFDVVYHLAAYAAEGLSLQPPSPFVHQNAQIWARVGLL